MEYRLLEVIQLVVVIPRGPLPIICRLLEPRPLWGRHHSMSSIRTTTMRLRLLPGTENVGLLLLELRRHHHPRVIKMLTLYLRATPSRKHR